MIKEITDPKYYFNVKAKKYIQKNASNDKC